MHHDKADCRNCSLVAHAIGLVIGHEISRAFDDHGQPVRRRGKSAQLVNEGDVCTALPGSRVNGALMPEENVADNPGARWRSRPTGWPARVVRSRSSTADVPAKERLWQANREAVCPGKAP